MKSLLVAGAVALALAAPAAAGTPANVTIRVEGVTKTVLKKTAVRTTTTPVSKDGDPEHSCEGTTAAGALEVATAGDWGGTYYDGLGWSVERVFDYRLSFDSTAERNYYFAYWRNYEFQNVGVCTEVQEGDELMLVPDCFGDCGHARPLRIEVPARAEPGKPFDVRVTEYTVTDNPDFSGTSTPHPSQGATVSVGGATVLTDAAGVARVSAERGPHSLRATKDGFVPSATESTCITDGADGFCGTVKPGDPAPPPPPACATEGVDGLCGTVDRTPPLPRIVGIAEGQRFARGDAPRELRGAIAADPTGLHAVKLRLTRRHRGRCSTFSGRRERFVPVTCGRRYAFRIGDRAGWSYLLPDELGPGRYVLDVIAIDRALNRSPLVRGGNRVVFHVS